MAEDTRAGVAREDWGDDDTPQHAVAAACGRGCSAAANSSYAAHVVLGTLALLLVGALYVAMSVSVPHAPRGSITDAVASADLSVASADDAVAAGDDLSAQPSPVPKGKTHAEAHSPRRRQSQSSAAGDGAAAQQQQQPQRRLGTRPARRPRPNYHGRRRGQHHAHEQRGDAVEPSEERPEEATTPRA